jgi:dihydroorotase-like cyclic amidohydrolase
VKLQKTLKPSDSFISVKDNNFAEVLSLKADGSIVVGNDSDIIIIDGKDGSITSSNFINGQGWKISNTNSIFNDVTIRGSIKASVLEYGQV